MLQRVCIFLLCIIGLFSFSFQTYASESDNSLSCAWWQCVHTKDFKINVGTITPGNTTLIDSGNSGEQTARNVLATIIDKLIIAFGVLSLLMMTLGAGYMIIYHGQDEFLSRWKSIFVAGLVSLAIALSAGLIVRFIAYLLYQ